MGYIYIYSIYYIICYLYIYIYIIHILYEQSGKRKGHEEDINKFEKLALLTWRLHKIDVMETLGVSLNMT